MVVSEMSRAQSDIKCNYCNKEISGNYIQVENLYFHTNHFICSHCKKVISGLFTINDEKFYHPDCNAVLEGLICSYCNKVINGEYTEQSGKKYHRSCYENNIVPKCAICSEPLTGQYAIDAYGNEYHYVHSNEFKECDNCGRLICKSLTNGGRQYSDGRHICGICYSDAVFDLVTVKRLYSGVITRLRSLGMKFNNNNISIKSVDQNELRKAAGNYYNSSAHGYCRSDAQNEYLNNKLSKSVIKHTIFVLNGIPSINTEAVIAHELMHVWLVENTENNHSDQLREGSCNFIAYLYLISLNNSKSTGVIKLLENDQDNVYGKGFNMVRSKFKNQDLNRFLDYLKINKSL